MITPPTEPGTVNVVVGTRHFLGPTWTHVDVDSSPLWDDADDTWHPVDVVCDASQGIPLPDQYADLVFSSEALEHFPRAIYQSVLAEWARLVKPGGLLRIEVPDFLQACQQILETDTLKMDRDIQCIFFAGQVNQYDFHYVGLTPRMLEEDMMNLGLEVVSVERGNECGWLRVVGRRPLS